MKKIKFHTPLKNLAKTRLFFNTFTDLAYFHRIKPLFFLTFTITITVSIMTTVSCSSPDFDEELWRRRVYEQNPALLYETNLKDGKFYNPWNQQNKKFTELLRWKLSKTDRVYSEEEKNYLPQVTKVDLQKLLEKTEDFILWVGHGTFLIQINEVLFLTDPILTKRALLPTRLTPPAFTKEELKNVTKPIFVLITHNHYDHFDIETLKFLPEKSSLITPLGYEKYQKDIPQAKFEMMNWWEEISVNIEGVYKDIKITALPAQHWSKRVDQGTNKSLWAGYMIQTSKKKIYFAGDTGHFIGFKEIGKKFHPIDYALIPTTAYHPRWFMHYAHIDVKEAIDAFKDVQARYFIPTQWGTFKLGDNSPGVPGLDLKNEITRQNLDPNSFLILNIGDVIPIR